MYKTFQELMNKKIVELEETKHDLQKKMEAIINEKISFFDINKKRKLQLKKMNITKIYNQILELEEQVKKLKNKSFIGSDEISEIIKSGIELDLSDVEYLNSKKYDNESKHIERIEDILLVHKTDFAPIKGVIYSPKSTNAKKKDTFMFNNKEYEYEYLAENDTLHFCLNAHVTDHDLGHWEDRKYAVILPFDKVNKENLIRTDPHDTYFLNEVILPEGSTIICPENDKEKISKQNPNVEIITYNNSISLDQAIECVILYKGYKIQEVNTHGWIDYHENHADDDTDNLKTIQIENNLVDKEREHYSSELLLSARLRRICNKTVAFINCLIDNNLEEIDDKTVNSTIKSIGLFGDHIVTKKVLLSYISSLIEKIKEEKIPIDDDDFSKTINDIINSINGLETTYAGNISNFYDYLDSYNSMIILKLLAYSNQKKQKETDIKEILDEEKNNPSNSVSNNIHM